MSGKMTYMYRLHWSFHVSVILEQNHTLPVSHTVSLSHSHNVTTATPSCSQKINSDVATLSFRQSFFHPAIPTLI